MFTVPRVDVLVRCPRCDGPALVGDRRVTCTGCGYSRVDGSKNPGYFCGCCLAWEGATSTPGVPVRVHQVLHCPDCGQDETRMSDHPDERAAALHPAFCRCGAPLREKSRIATSMLDGSLPVDRLFGLPLWLRMPCAGHVLWAANAEHLDYLEESAGPLNRPWPRGAHQLASRLPGWMMSAGNRSAVLAGIERLRKELPAGSSGGRRGPGGAAATK